MASVINETIYSTEVHVTGGRDGRARSEDGLIDLALAPPGSSRGTNPEQLFAAGWGACFLSALQLVARRRDIDASKASLTAQVTLGKEASGDLALKARLEVDLPQVAPDVLEDLVQQAHQVCPYSRATRGNIEVELSIAEHA